jgi:PAS domain S-box-containing protein
VTTAFEQLHQHQDFLGKTMENIRMLMIEDDRVDQMSFTRYVAERHLPYDYTIAGSVSGAKKALHEKSFDIVITDYLLGDGTALDIMELIKGVPVVITTGAGNQEIAVNTMKAGAYDYLIKDPENSHLKVLPMTVEKAMQRKKVEKQVRMLTHAVMSTSDSVFITDMADAVIFVNQAFCETYGYGEEEIVGRKSTMLGEVGWQGEYSHLRKDGSEFPVSVSRSVIKDDHGGEMAIVVVARDITQRKQVELERERLIQQLQEALAKVKTLSGLLPICASCKKIRDDKGYWHQVETYFMEHSEANFSHGICPECVKKLYPQAYKKLCMEDSDKPSSR